MYVGATPQSRERLREVLTRILLSAPNNFFQLPNTLPGEEFTLEGSIEQLRRGINHVFQKSRQDAWRNRMIIVLDEIEQKFQSNDINGGRIQCHDLQELINDAPT